MSFLVQLIRHVHKREGFISALIFGSQGIGKTSYALHVAKEVYGDWSSALDCLFFDPSLAIDHLDKALNRGERIPLIIMDDAGLWLGKSQWWKKEKVEFAEFFDIIRTVCSPVIFTTPSDNLLSRLSHEIQLRIKISPIDSETYNRLKRSGRFIDVNRYRVAKIYHFSLSPLFQPIVRKSALDVFPLHYPDDVKREYDKKRLNAVKQKLLKVKRSLKSDLKIKVDKKDIDAKIVELLNQGYSKTEIARILGICRTTVYNRLKKMAKSSN